MDFRSQFNLSQLNSRARVAAVLVLLCCAFSAAFGQNAISTVAGGGLVNGPAMGPNADIPGPSSVATDAAGNTYFAVPAAQEVMKVDSSGNLTVFAGMGYPTENPKQFDNQPATSGSLYGPTGLAVDASGNVYIADTINQLIRKVSTGGIMTTVAGTGTICAPSTSACGDGGKATSAMFNLPSAVAVDSSGNIYIADSGDNRIREIAAGTGIISTIAGTGAACANPTSACGDGKTATSAQLNYPLGVVVDRLGNIGIADTGDRRIRAIQAGKTTIFTYAGTGNPCNVQAGCGDGGKATKANLTAPWQLSVDSAENLYIADGPENRIRKVNSTDSISTIAGTGTAGFSGDGGAPKNAALDSPHGIAVDASGNLYIADSGNQRIRTVVKNVIKSIAGGGLGGDGSAATSAILGADHAVAVDSLGNLYIADTANNRIREVTPGNPPGNITTIAGTGSAGYSGDNGAAALATLNSPLGLAIDGSNNIYVADSLNGVVRLINTSGVITTIAGNGQPCQTGSSCGDGGSASQANLSEPTAVALDSAGNVYISDYLGNRVRMVNTAGIISTLVDSNGAPCASPTQPCGDGGPAANAHLYGPFGLAVDANNNVYIADQGDNRVRVVSNGIINAYAFTGATGDAGDAGSALTATCTAPQYLSIDARGNLFVSSAAFYTIRRVDAPTGTMATVAGHIGDPTQFGYSGDGNTSTKAMINNFGIVIDPNDNLYIADGGNNRVRNVEIAAGANLSAPSTNFTTPQPIGTTSPPMSFTDKDTGYDDLFISSVTVTGPFALVNNSPCTDNLIAPGLKCTFQVTFTPTTYGVASGKVSINDNAYNYPTQIMYLTGYGPDFTLSASPNSLTVARGSQGNSTLTFTPSAGFNQPIGISCAGAPSGTTCTANPNSVTPDGTDPTMSNLTVNVGSSTLPGNYTLKVTGSSVTTHSTTIALTVQ